MKALVSPSILVAGMACRLPGASSVDSLWELLLEGRCVVSAPPADRSWFRKFLHPRRGEPGFSYTFDGGYLTEPYLFDPSV
ncbi:MAG: beta-ketoacyl synthase N-terminal-like domain-containing protein, partial [Alsobacter sp.]